MNGATTALSSDAARLGLTVTFRPGDCPELVVDDLRRLGVRRLRAVFSAVEWADDAVAAADLLEALARHQDVLPCVVTTPPPPGEGALADFVEALLARCDPDVAWVELRVEAATPEVLDAARLVRALGRRLVLSLAARAFVDHARDMPLELACAVGVELDCDASATWADAVDRARAALPGCPAWVVRAGCSTFPHEDLEQARALLAALRLPVERCYWDGPRDGPAREDGGDLEPRARARGLLEADGREKLAARLLVGGGLEALREAVSWAERPVTQAQRGGEPPVLITGGAGFVGSNLAARLLAAGRRVVLYDDLSRRGVEQNARWLLTTFGDGVRLELGCVRDRVRLRQALEGTAEVFHLAAQVAVTTSLLRPTLDFEVNALGTHVLLEELRLRKDRGQPPPAVLFTSTNKVYGDLADLALEERDTRWEPADPGVRARGVSEARRLDLHSPYGCSKGAADQYVLEYARTFGLRGVVFRMSCIYGPRQLGTPDQGWVSQFASCAIEGAPLTIYGDGKQVRDLLHVDDLVDAFLVAVARSDDLSGAAFNIGGGPANAVSLLELLELLRGAGAHALPVAFASPRPGDQRYYVSDTARFRAATGWTPRVDVATGVARLVRWLRTSPSYGRRARSA